MKCVLIVGSESGNAEMSAEAMQEVLEEANHEVVMVSESDDIPSLDDVQTLLVCCATTGVGDIPGTIEPLFNNWTETKPDLSAHTYAVVALGDVNYRETFCSAGKKWDALLSNLGAKQLKEILTLDAEDNPMPDEDAAEWTRALLESL